MREFVTIRHFDDQTKAGLAKAVLEAAGIRSSLANEHLVGANWGTSDGQIRLQVDGDDAKFADKILKDTSQVEFPEGIEGEAFDDFDDVSDESGPGPKLEPTRREEDAQWALTLAKFGWLLFPLQPIASLVLLKVLLSRQRLEPPYRRKAWIAAAINAPLLIALLLLALLIISDQWADSQKVHQPEMDEQSQRHWRQVLRLPTAP